VDNFTRFLEDNPEIREWVMENTDFENINWSNLIQQLVSFTGDGLKSIFGGAVGAIGSLTNGIVNTFVAVAFSIYALARKEILARQGRRLLYSLVPEHIGDETVRILRLTNTTFSNFISGQFLEAIILGGLFAVAMLIFGMPYIALVSVIISVTALIPLVGAFVGCFLGAFFILVDNPVQALTFVAMFLVIQQLENNLIYPRVVGTSIGLPGMFVLAAVTVGGELMGVGGMLVMIPLTSVVYTLLREFTERRLALRKVPQWKLMDQPPELRSKFRETRERKKERKLLKKMKAMAEKRSHKN
jgi:predicted PurR-regulated permease PerM